MAVLLASLAAFSPDGNPVRNKINPKILAVRDNGLVVELTVLCGKNGFGIMHCDKISKVYSIPKMRAFKSPVLSCANTCVINIYEAGRR